MLLFHISPAHYRDAILREGLDPDKCREPRGRVWFYTDEGRAKAHAGWPNGSDVWVLDADAAFLMDWSWWRTAWDDAACYVTTVVPPSLLRRV